MLAGIAMNSQKGNAFTSGHNKLVMHAAGSVPRVRR
jgi:hypothetical protein